MIKEDIDFKLLNNILKEYKSNYKLTLNDYIHNIVYIKNNRIISFIIYSFLYENIEIIDVYSIEKERNHGYSSLLFYKIINKNNYKNITLEVSKNNNVAINLYIKLGFKKVAIRKNYYKDSDAFLMLKSR